jgi:translation initiation factor 1A
MPNVKGGKNYKKMKHQEAAAPEVHDIGEGQMIGRVLRMLGDRRALVYCNDNVERVCKIRGKLRKKVWIATSDIVLVGLRIFAGDDSDDDQFEGGPLSKCDMADILAKYDPDVYSKLKKVDGVNKRLFGLVEVGDSKNPKNAKDVDDDYIDFENEEDDEEVVEEASGNKKSKNPNWKRTGAAAGDDDDVDIDAI